MSFFINRKTHLGFLAAIFVTWLFSLYLIFFPVLLIYSLVLYLHRVRPCSGEVDFDSIYAPVSGKVMEIVTETSHPFFGESMTQIRLSLPWWRDWGIYFPTNGEVLDLKKFSSTRFYRFAKLSYPDTTGTCFTIKLNSGDIIGIQSVRCILGGSFDFNILPGDRGRAKAMLGYFLFGGSISLYVPSRYNIDCKKGDWIAGADTVLARVL